MTATLAARWASGGGKGKCSRFVRALCGMRTRRAAWSGSVAQSVLEGGVAGARRAPSHPRESRAVRLVSAPRDAPISRSMSCSPGWSARGRSGLPPGLGGPASARWRRRSRHGVRSARPRWCLFVWGREGAAGASRPTRPWGSDGSGRTRARGGRTAAWWSGAQGASGGVGRESYRGMSAIATPVLSPNPAAPRSGVSSFPHPSAAPLQGDLEDGIQDGRPIIRARGRASRPIP